MKKVKVFYDLETTGTKLNKHSIHQIAGFIEVDGVLVEKFDIKTRPHAKATYDDEAMRICGVTEEQLKGYPPMTQMHKKFVNMIGAYIDKYDPTSKAKLIGYNNRAFDDLFLRAWFEQCGDNYIGSLFWADTLDALVLASEYLEDRRPQMPNFQQGRVAKELGIVVDDTKLHDAFYDVKLTRSIYRIVTGREIEL